MTFPNMIFQDHGRLRTVFRAVAIAAALAAAGCSSSQDKAAREALTAQILMDGGDLPNARAAIIRSIAQRDDIADNHMLQARIEMGLRNPVGAFMSFSRALDLDAASAEALIGVAETGLQIGRVREASTAADKILAIDPASARALLVKGMIVLDEGRPPKALQYAEKILGNNASDEGGIVLKARATALMGDYNGALGVLNQAMATLGETDAMNVTAMEISRARGDAKGLISSFQKILAKAPDNGVLLVDYANTLYKTGNAAAARDLLENAIETQKDRESVLKSIVALWSEYDQTAPSNARVSALGESGSPAARMVIGRYLLTMGRPADAEVILRGFATPKAYEATALYGRILYALGQKDKATAIAADVLSEDEDNGDALILRAELALEKGKAIDAINDLQMVLRDDPLNGQAYALQARAYEARKQAWRSRQLFALGLDRNPQDHWLLSRYLEFLYRSGDNSQAMTAARKHAKATPGSIRAWKTYASVCERAANAACRAEASHGLQSAMSLYAIDQAPGTPKQRGLFGRL